MDVYLIIGDANTGKSSLIRCLTGCAQYGTGNFALTNGTTISTYVVISSLQESAISPSSFIQDVQDALKDGRIDPKLEAAVLVPLREDSVNDYPAASQYITEFENAGWTIVKTALLDSQTPTSNYPHCQGVTDVMSKPINVSAAAVRQHFGWI